MQLSRSSTVLLAWPVFVVFGNNVTSTDTGQENKKPLAAYASICANFRYLLASAVRYVLRNACRRYRLADGGYGSQIAVT